MGDRSYAIVDEETGKVVSAKSARLFPSMFACRATFVEEPRAGMASPPVMVTLPDGSRVTNDEPDCDDVPRDNDVLRTLIRHNRLELEGGARFPCAGVYAVVEASGVLRQGDVVTTS